MQRLKGLFRLIPELWGFARTTRKVWLSLVILALVLLGLLILLTESAAVMPWIYTLF